VKEGFGGVEINLTTTFKIGDTKYIPIKIYEVNIMAKASKKADNKKEESCKPHTKLWCISIMAVAIIVLTWLASVSATWSRIVVTILAVAIFVRSMIVNCCK